MPNPSFLVALLAVACASAPERIAAPDPIATDGDKYSVLFENERVRVLRYHDDAGQKTHPHAHPDAVVYALAPFERRLTLPDGGVRALSFRAGDVAFVPAQTHTGENVGTTATDVLIVELKEPRTAAAKR